MKLGVIISIEATIIVLLVGVIITLYSTNGVRVVQLYIQQQEEPCFNQFPYGEKQGYLMQGSQSMKLHKEI